MHLINFIFFLCVCARAAAAVVGCLFFRVHHCQSWYDATSQQLKTIVEHSLSLSHYYNCTALFWWWRAAAAATCTVCCIMCLPLWKWLINGNSATSKMSQPKIKSEERKKIICKNKYRVFLTLWVDRYAMQPQCCISNDLRHAMWNLSFYMRISTCDCFLLQIACMLVICTSAAILQKSNF